MSTFELHTGDALKIMPTLADKTFHSCVTSPPYFGLRDYGHQNQIGMEHTPEAFVAALVEVFREVKRVLRDDGTLWLNLGDSYAGSGKGGNPANSPHQKQKTNAGSITVVGNRGCGDDRRFGLKHKDLIGIPWRVAFALQADGWYLRQDIIWHKPNPMPESVTDRCTKAHEYIFLLSKSPKYYYDQEAIKEPAIHAGAIKHNAGGKNSEMGVHGQTREGFMREGGFTIKETRNKRSVWTVTTKPYAEAHFATFPPDLIRPCILAGCPDGGMVLDPFNGAGTTGVVCVEENRNYVGIDLNPDYVSMSRKRILQRTHLGLARH